MSNEFKWIKMWKSCASASVRVVVRGCKSEGVGSKIENGSGNKESKGEWKKAVVLYV